MFGLGYIFKITLLLVNAVAILNEERFLARSASPLHFSSSFIMLRN